MLKNKIIVSKPELLYDVGELPFVYVDGSCCTKRREDGKIEFFTTYHLNHKHQQLHFVGTPEKPFETELEQFKIDFNGYRQVLPSGIWIQSHYECEDGTFIGFCHREDLPEDDIDYPQNYHLGFAVSYDKGNNWKYVGDVLGSCCNYISKRRSGGKWPNLGGVPFFPGKDGYFYFYFNEYNANYERYVSGARLPMKEAIEMIKREENPAYLVKKYSGNGVWNTEPEFGTAAPMIPTDLKDVNYVSEIGYEYDAHSDAAYCSALDKYILILQSARQVIMFLSDDGANWSDHVVLFTAEPDSGLTYYSTIVGMDDEATDDFSTVGHKFCVHFSHKPEFNRLPNNYGNYAKDKYYRCCVTID